MKKQLRNKPDIVSLITKLQEQITLLERKVDALLGQSLSKPAEIKPFPKPFQQPFLHPVSTNAENGNRQDNRFQAGNRQDNRHGERFMHKAICADCKKQCEVPFIPREGRPVYCQECFSRRKSNSSFKANSANRPRAVALFQAAHMDRPQAIEKKKAVGKKKTVSKKRKK
jgi:CxxC-x17-CxxC domain-containing protein